MALQKEEAFLKTVELGSLTLAAQELGRTQSAISHSIRALEEELGLTLMTRGKSGVRLTREGERLLPYLRELQAAQTALAAEARRLGGAGEGQVRIGAFTSVAVHWLPGIIKAFQDRYPGTEIGMFNGDYADVDRWLLSGEIDLGFITLPAPEGCAVTVQRDDELMALLPLNHPLAALERVPASALVKEPFISLLQSSNQDVDRALGAKPEVRFTTKDDYAIIAMVEQGLGVAVVPELLMAGRHDAVALRPLEPAAKRTIALARRAGPLPPAAEQFARCAADWVAGQ